MNSKLSAPLIGVVVAVLLVGGFFLTRNQTKGIEAKTKVLQEETEKQRTAMKEAYDKRAELLKDWLNKARSLKDKNFNEVQFSNALEETKVNPLKSQVDFDRFDWVQNDISNQAAILVGILMKSNSADGMSHVRELERIERDIIVARQNYHTSAFQFNDIAAGVLSKALVRLQPIPVFKVEAVMKNEKGSVTK